MSRGSQNDFIQIEEIIASIANVLTHLISEPELFFAELHASTKTLCHAEAFIVELACELETNPTEPGAGRGVNTDTGSQLADDRPEVPGFEATPGGERA